MSKKKQKPDIQKIVSIRLKDIVPSESNPREDFPVAGLKELAASIAEQGQLQAIIVRASGKKYEIVCGERRYHAMKDYVKGCSHINAVIRKLDDEEALEIQVIENLQRENVHPLAEAQAFATLLKKKSLDMVAGIIGKSESYILKRLKLNDLIPEAKKIYNKGTMTYGHALHICRLPKEEQKKVFEWLEDQPLQDGQVGPTVTDLKEHIESTIMLKMADAPWDLKDKELYKEAGACSVCPKRTSCNKTLFDDFAPKDDLCTDAACFTHKKSLHIGAARQKLRAQGIEPISAEEIRSYGSTLDEVKVAGKRYKTIRKTECDNAEPVVLEKTDNYSSFKKKIGSLLYVCRDEKCKVHNKIVKPSKASKRSLQLQKKQEENNNERERRKACDEILFKDLLLKKEMPLQNDEMDIIIKQLLERDHEVTALLLHCHGLLKVTQKEIELYDEGTDELNLYAALESKLEGLIDNAQDDWNKEQKKSRKTLDHLLISLINKFKHPMHLMRLVYAWNAKGDERTDNNFLFATIRALGFNPEEAEKKFDIEWKAKQNPPKVEEAIEEVVDELEEEEIEEQE